MRLCDMNQQNKYSLRYVKSLLKMKYVFHIRCLTKYIEF